MRTSSKLKSKQGCAPFGVEMKIVDDDDKALPWDGKTFGRLKVRGFAVAKAYFKGEGGDILDENGFFDTGDVATIDAERLHADHRPRQGRHQVRRRVDFLDRHRESRRRPSRCRRGRGHRRATTRKWDERPLLVVVPKEGCEADARGPVRDS